MKHLFFAFLGMILFSGFVRGEEGIVEYHYGIQCVPYIIKEGESFIDISRKFFVRPSTLALCNNMNPGNRIKVHSTLWIPLTETNFYQTLGKNTDNADFMKVVHIVGQDENIKAICKDYAISINMLLKWNPEYIGRDIIPGDRLFIGWLKYDPVLRKEMPAFVREDIRRNDEKLYDNKVKEYPDVPRVVSKAEERTQVSGNKTGNTIERNTISTQTESISSKVYSDQIKNALPEAHDLPSEIETEKRILRLLKTTTCKGSFFYSGATGGKYYAFSNVAKKGGIIKVTNMANNRYVLVEILGDLPVADFNQGILIRISDNAKKALDGDKDILDVKLNY